MAQASLKNAAVSGAFWSALATVLNRSSRFIVTILLARILLPQDFGLVAMASLIMNVATLLGELGIGAALIQRKEITDEHLSTGFWVNVFIGVLLFAAAWFVAPAAATFFQHPDVALVFRGMAVSLIISPIGSIHWVILNRELEFKKLMISQTISTMVRIATALTLALMGYGYWALVWGPVVSPFVGTIVNWTFVKWRPKFVFHWGRFKELFRFGRNVFGEKLLGYFAANSDYLITGRVLGAEILGYYNFSYTFPHLAQTHITPIVTRVLFPVLSKLQDEAGRLRAGYLRSLAWITAISAPFSIGLGVTAPDLVPVVFGDQWYPVIIPMQILSALGLLNAMTSTVWTVQQAKGRPEIGVWWNLFTVPVLIGALIVSSRWGIHAVAWTMTILGSIFAISIQHITNRLIEMPWSDYLKSVGPCVAAALFMGIIVCLLRAVAAAALQTEHPGLHLGLSTLVGAGTYLLGLRLFASTFWKEAAELIGERFAARARAKGEAA